jgi:hypothetical protein
MSTRRTPAPGNLRATPHLRSTRERTDHPR